MSRKLRVIDHPGDDFWIDHGDGEDWRAHGTRVEPGDMWREPLHDIEGREAWEIALPNYTGTWWTTCHAGGTGNLWDVTGEPPNITVKPSIDSRGGTRPGAGWHGFITNGEMTP